VLLRRLDYLQISGSLRGIKASRSGAAISHLFFADDALFFLKADIENFGVMKNTIDQSCNLSGEMALVFKQAWRMHSNPQLNVSKIFRAKYKDDCFDKGRRGEMKSSMSWGARSIFKRISHLQGGLRRTIANGESIKVEHDWWVTNNVIKCKDNQLCSTEQKPVFISELLDEQGKWKVGLVWKWFSLAIAKDILAIHPLNQLQSDGWDWGPSSTRHYSLRSGYWQAQGTNTKIGGQKGPVATNDEDDDRNQRYNSNQANDELEHQRYTIIIDDAWKKIGRKHSNAWRTIVWWVIKDRGIVIDRGKIPVFATSPCQAEAKAALMALQSPSLERDNIVMLIDSMEFAQAVSDSSRARREIKQIVEEIKKMCSFIPKFCD
uniref:Uncharacterized protein n=1 Tax=Chenopodium quinoa TaxID=63459 RepID=A0A803NAM0_CHEQI